VSGSTCSTSAPPTNVRAAVAERRFAGAVVLAAIASVPATLLTLTDGAAATAGHLVNALTLLVFLAEAVVLFALADDRRLWLRRHRLLIGITIATIPAVLLALGPVQVLRVLRVLRVVGGLRILRVRRVLKAARVLRSRAGLRGPAWRLTSGALTLAGAAVVGLVLSDPTSTTRQLLDSSLSRFGPLPVLLAGATAAVATYVLARQRRHRG
jgi:hypothetical protein